MRTGRPLWTDDGASREQKPALHNIITIALELQRTPVKTTVGQSVEELVLWEETQNLYAWSYIG